MRYTRFICVLLAATCAFSLMAKKPKDNNKYGVYIAGVSASFTDSLVYFTDVQFVDSAFVKGGFLTNRQQYSEQLSDFLERYERRANPTSFVFFDAKKKNVEKEIEKLRKKYKKNGGILMKEVDSSFKFKKAVIY